MQSMVEGRRAQPAVCAAATQPCFAGSPFLSKLGRNGHTLIWKLTLIPSITN